MVITIFRISFGEAYRRVALTLSLPNATVAEFTVHCQMGLESKFKSTFNSCLFLTVIRDANLCSLFYHVQVT